MFCRSTRSWARPPSPVAPGPLESDEDLVLSPHRRPPQLHVAVGRHAVGPPVLDRDRRDAAVHEDAVGLTHEERAELAPGLPDVERRLARVRAHAEEVELELGLQLAPTRRKPTLDAEAALAHARPEVAVLAELVRKRRQLRRPLDVEPVRVDLVEVVDRVELGEAVDLHSRPGLRWNRGRLTELALGRHLALDHHRRRRGRRGGCQLRAMQSEVGGGRDALADGDAARETGREARDFRGDVIGARRDPPDSVRPRLVRDRRLAKSRRQIPGGDRRSGHRGARRVGDASLDPLARLGGCPRREQQQKNPHRQYAVEASSPPIHKGSFRRRLDPQQEARFLEGLHHTERRGRVIRPLFSRGAASRRGRGGRLSAPGRRPRPEPGTPRRRPRD